jgi:hypothetical protein
MTLEEWLGPRPMAAVGVPVVSAPAVLANPPLPLPAGLHADNSDALLAQDARVAQLFATGGAAAALPAFRETPLSGCTTLLDLARRDAGFDPTQVKTQDPRVATYFQRLSECPLFERIEPSGGWDNMPVLHVEQLNAPLFDRCLPQTRDAVAGRLGTMLAAAGDADFRVDPIYHSVVAVNDGGIVVQTLLLAQAIFYQTIFIPDGNIDMPRMTQARVPVNAWTASRFLTLRFRTEVWAQAAAAVSAAHYQSVTDWLAGN